MCGVFAIGSMHPSQQATEASVRASLHHRGPDSSGYAAVAAAGAHFELGHTRLSIRDLSMSGHQPMWSRDRRWLLTYNGEIYNNDELRQQLDGPWRGTSDTETIVEYIAKFGVERTLASLNGMYAMVVIDTETGQLTAARDPSGIKPLYYEQAGDEIVLASEIRALRDHGFARGALDRAALATYLRFRYVPDGNTLIQGVRRVSAGERISWQQGRIIVSRFRGPVRPVPAAERPRTLADAATRFGHILDAAIARQLVSDVSLGVLLSGGIDSAIVASGLRRAGGDAPCFTVGFPGHEGGVSELDAAAETARVLGLKHYPLRLTARDLIDVSLSASAHLEEPLGTTSVLAMWHLCAHARNEVTVALAGQGADEHLGGYRRHRLEALRTRMPSWADSALGAVGRGMRPWLPSPTLRALSDTFGHANWLAAYAAMRSVFDTGEITRLGVATTEQAATQTFRHSADALATPGSSLRKSLALDAQSQLADDLLLYGDKMSMAHSLEVRVPFLDAEVVAFLAELPDEFKVTPRATKIVLKAYASRSLPDAILQRPKRGFQIPNLFRDAAFRERSRELVAAACAATSLDLNQNEALQIIDRAAQGGAHETRGWTLHSLASWAHACRT